MKTLDLTVQGMHCEGCAKTVEALLTSETGVKSATVSFSTSSAQIFYDPAAIKPERVVKAVERAGYRVQEVR